MNTTLSKGFGLPLRYDGPTDLRYELRLPLRMTPRPTTDLRHRATFFGAQASVAFLELGVDFGAWCGFLSLLLVGLVALGLSSSEPFNFDGPTASQPPRRAKCVVVSGEWGVVYWSECSFSAASSFS